MQDLRKRKKTEEKRPVSTSDDKFSSKYVPVGLENLGNNCYQNVVIQCLLRQQNVVEYFSSERTGVLSSALRKLATTLTSSGFTASLSELNNAIKTASPGMASRFSPLVQMDAHEFLVFLLTRLEMELPWESNELFDELFVVREVAETICLSCGCGGGSSSDQTTVLTLPLSAEGTGSVLLQDCIELYVNSSVDHYVCQDCKTEDLCARRVVFSYLPRSVVIHLRRFTVSDGIASKNDRVVSCPVRLRLPFCVPETEETTGERNRLYALQGFIVHIGRFADEGHYVSYYKIHKRWYKFDDSVVTTVEPADLPCAMAYILFYGVDCDEGKPESVSALFKADVGESDLSKVQSNKDIDNDDKNSTHHDPNSTQDDSNYTQDGNSFLHDDSDPSNVVLYEWDDISGAVLDTNDLAKYRVVELARWLYCRNITKASTKDGMISQIRMHVAKKQAEILWSGVDGGYWLERKRSIMQRNVGEEVVEEPIFPITGWRPFPSRDVPAGFNRGRVYEYLVATRPGISKVAGKRVYASLGAQDSKPGSEKISRRAQRLIDSDFVHAPCDNVKGASYFFVKAYVRASMNPVRYFVWVVLSAVSGKVLSANCDECMASSLHRCAHVGSLLGYMLSHVEKKGYEAVSSTGRARTWGLGTVRRDPGRTIRQDDYKNKRDQVKRYSHDPRPTAYATDTMEEEEINYFTFMLQCAEVSAGTTPQAFQNLLPIKYEDFVLNEEDKDIVLTMCSQFYDSLRAIARTDPFLIPGTDRQADSDDWRRFRCILFTASIARRVLGLSSVSAKSNFVREHLWGVKVFTGNKATRYGQRNEQNARKDYLLRQREKDPTTTIEETGLWIKKSYPMLGCSPDGIVRSKNTSVKLLEIKCPAVLSKCDPSHFDTRLTNSQQRNFSLVRRDGHIHLKRNHDHYYQVQMQMDVLKIYSCDYIVWSAHGLVIVPVTYDDEFWAPKRAELVDRHISFLVPEYFLMRILRNLPIVEMFLET